MQRWVWSGIKATVLLGGMLRHVNTYMIIPTFFPTDLGHLREWLHLTRVKLPLGDFLVQKLAYHFIADSYEKNSKQHEEILRPR